MAQNLSMTTAGYSKIERGETDLSVNRLADIAKILEVDISTIWNFDEKQIFNISNTNNHQVAIGNRQAYVSQNDKMIDHLEKEVIYLRTENSRLLDMLNRDKV